MRTSAPLLQRTKTITLAGLFALGLACGSSPSPIGETQQPISQDDDAEDSASDACAAGVAPADAAEGQCTITARALCFPSREAACACAGCGLDECAIGESFPEQAFCPSDGGGSDPDRPVSDDPDAPVSSEPGGGVSGSPGGSGTPAAPGAGNGASSGVSGCGSPGHDPGAPAACDGGRPAGAEGRCDFVVGGSCFDSVESACACAGCDADQCVVLESYPAQIRCL